MRGYKPAVLRNFIAEVLIKLDVPEEDARIVAEVLLKAELRGLSSHGILRFPHLIRSIEAGFQMPKTEVTIEREKNNCAVVNGNSGLGIIIAKKAMEMAIEKARDNGIASVGVYNTNHFGIAGYYAELATKSDMIGVAMCNTEPAMAPFGGKTPIFGTNPLAVAIPTNKHEHPIILDMATSNVARGKILAALKAKRMLEEDCALDKDGNVTIYPEKAFSLLPLGGKKFGYKGYGLAFVIDILCGPLVNAQCGKDVKGTVSLEKCTKGDLFIAIDISSFTDLGLFKSAVEQLIQEVKNDGAMFPGEIEQVKEERNSIEGVKLEDDVYEELKEIERGYGIGI